jgi:hypothetical protein
MGLQPYGDIHNSLAGDAHHMLFFNVQPVNQPTITVLVLSRENVLAP